MGKSKFSFFLMDVILLIVFLGSTLTIFKLSGFGFILEALLLLGLLFVGFVALIPAFNNKNAGWGFLSAVCFIALLNLLIINNRTNLFNKTMLITSFFAALGFFIGMAKLKVAQPQRMEPEEESTKKVKTTFTPGKFIASSQGTTYHKPTCLWAKKIKEARQIWFDSAEEADKKYKPHSCLKK
ncbi:MAG: hypothetical protein O2779_04680 [Nanoarchaeota archaeon]|nr:hypothetical protein [Nanoarchaeota archaeon]